MDGLWLQDIEAFEQISQDEPTRRLFLRMAQLQRAGRVSSFLDELEHAAGVGDEVKDELAEIARDIDFLLALEDYLHRTRRFH